ncbi:hypothetical protein V8G54_034791 [Vigna mungo]|uniref:Uncharacterized protein n=1 Tax=Vigna mungo TaxID=3915 RepID=A0AAQ3RDV1_VIGMU
MTFTLTHSSLTGKNKQYLSQHTGPTCQAFPKPTSIFSNPSLDHCDTINTPTGSGHPFLSHTHSITSLTCSFPTLSFARFTKPDPNPTPFSSNSLALVSAHPKTNAFP